MICYIAGFEPVDDDEDQVGTILLILIIYLVPTTTTFRHTTLQYFCINHGDQRIFLNLKSS